MDNLHRAATDTPRVASLGEPLQPRAWRTKLAALLFLTFVLAASFFYQETPANGLVLCPVRYLTGLECAGCGMTRSWCAIADGRIDLAVALNPFGPILMALAVAKVATLVPEVATRRQLVLPLWERVRAPLLGTLAAAMIGFGILRAVRFFFGA